MMFSQSNNTLKLLAVLIMVYGLSSCGKDDEHLSQSNKGIFSKATIVKVDYSRVHYVGRTFQDGRFPFCRHKKCGFIDTTGKEIIPPQYDEVSNFSEGLAKVTQITGNRGYFGIGGDKHSGFIDKTGKVLIPISDTYEYGYGFHSGLVFFKSDEKSGFMDKTGKIAFLLPQGISSVEHFSDGLVKIKNHENNKYGFMDTQGNIVIPTQYDNALDFSNGLAAVKQGDVWGYVDKTGKEVIPLQYRNANSFGENVATVEKSLGNYVIIDKTGKEIRESEYANSEFHEELTSFSEYQFEKTKNKQGEQDFRSKKLVGFMDKNGKKVIPAQYRKVYAFSDGLAAVLPDNSTVQTAFGEVIKNGSGWGYIDKTGKMVIKPQFGDVEKFTDGLARVTKNGEECFINKKGKVVIRFVQLPEER